MSYHETMADREQARELGRADPGRAWVLTDRDVWHPNPFYTGPEVRHPEDDDFEQEEHADGVAPR